MLEWVATPFSRGCSPPRDWAQVSCIAGRFFTSEPPWEPTGNPELGRQSDSKGPPSCQGPCGPSVVTDVSCEPQSVKADWLEHILPPFTMLEVLKEWPGHRRLRGLVRTSENVKASQLGSKSKLLLWGRRRDMGTPRELLASPHLSVESRITASWSAPQHGLVEFLRIHTLPIRTTLGTICVTKNVLLDSLACNFKGWKHPQAQFAFWSVLISSSAEWSLCVRPWAPAAGVVNKRTFHGPVDGSLGSSSGAHPYLFVFNAVFC